jgi:hypothetical protein
VAGTGPSGRNGFKCFDKRFEQEEFPYDHSEYFDKGHMEAKWLPFLNRNEPHIPAKNTQVPRPDEGKPWPLYAVYLFLLCCFCAVGYMIATGKIGVRSWTQDSTVKQSLGEIRHITTPSFYQSSSDDDADQNYSGPPHPGWTVKPQSISFIIEKRVKATGRMLGRFPRSQLIQR